MSDENEKGASVPIEKNAANCVYLVNLIVSPAQLKLISKKIKSSKYEHLIAQLDSNESSGAICSEVVIAIRKFVQTFVAYNGATAVLKKLLKIPGPVDRVNASTISLFFSARPLLKQILVKLFPSEEKQSLGNLAALVVALVLYIPKFAPKNYLAFWLTFNYLFEKKNIQLPLLLNKATYPVIYGYIINKFWTENAVLPSYMNKSLKFIFTELVPISKAPLGPKYGLDDIISFTNETKNIPFHSSLVSDVKESLVNAKGITADGVLRMASPFNKTVYDAIFNPMNKSVLLKLLTGLPKIYVKLLCVMVPFCLLLKLKLLRPIDDDEKSDSKKRLKRWAHDASMLAVQLTHFLAYSTVPSALLTLLTLNNKSLGKFKYWAIGIISGAITVGINDITPGDFHFSETFFRKLNLYFIRTFLTGKVAALKIQYPNNPTLKHIDDVLMVLVSWRLTA